MRGPLTLRQCNRIVIGWEILSDLEHLRAMAKIDRVLQIAEDAHARLTRVSDVLAIRKLYLRVTVDDGLQSCVTR